ncbi:MAG: hypothetical protein WDN45_15855 [Caulobacteraceae bacterium]
MALLILLIGPLVALRTPTDIFPNIGVPVIGVAWQYNRPVARRKCPGGSSRPTNAPFRPP